LVLGYYLAEFTQAMRHRPSGRGFPNLVYLDLFGGPGRGVFPSGETIDGSPIIAARTAPPFTKIVVAEADPTNAAVLEMRLAAERGGLAFRVFPRNCNDVVAELKAEIPRPRKVDGRWVDGVLTFCFVDPFSLNIDLSTLSSIRRDLFVDFLVLLADQMSGGRNEENFASPTNRTIDRLLADVDWRRKWADAAAAGQAFRDFLWREFTARMEALGLQAGTPMRVCAEGMGVKLYRLCFFSRHALGLKFWEHAVKNAPRQGSLFA
jgi:three-Cys-motif partner protein